LGPMVAKMLDKTPLPGITIYPVMTTAWHSIVFGWLSLDSTQLSLGFLV